MANYYQRIEVIIRHRGRGAGVSQGIVRDAVVAAGFEVVSSSSSAACPACEGKGYVNVQPIAPDSCLATSDTCETCGGDGRNHPAPVVELDKEHTNADG